MQYGSTRGEAPELAFRDAVETGLAPDGGLYLPVELPDISGNLDEWAGLSYPELTKAFLAEFATDLEPETLGRIVDDAYSRFDSADIAPLRQLEDGLYVLELFHGPTLAFKDFALQVLGNLYEEQIARTGRPINVLGATSGDTGSAAIHGLLGKEGVRIFILYPDGRISPLQERQMSCTGADNVFPIAIDGTFDDAQRIVKDLFGDAALKEELRLSAVNSINLARILAQCVYYVWAWLRLPEEKRDGVEFVVPTGNFGNVLAGWLAKQMGLPAGSFRVATNQNDILYRLFKTGVYEVSDVVPSLAPSMDIQVASNFERFLYYMVGRDSARVRAMMEEFKRTGRLVFEDLDHAAFGASRTTDAEIPGIIHRVYQDFNYVIDPHTACGFADAEVPATGARVVLATAHPAKFPDVIREAIGIAATHPSLEALKQEELERAELPADADAVREYLKANAGQLS